jgi:predicted patatin/cPLA2 family phospholipase
MEIDKLLDFLRHLIVILLIVYLTRKVFVLEDKVEKLYTEIKNSDMFEEEYSTDNEIQILNQVSAKSTEPIMINMPTKLDTSYYCSQQINNPLPSICKITLPYQTKIYTSPKSKSNSDNECKLHAEIEEEVEGDASERLRWSRLLLSLE